MERECVYVAKIVFTLMVSLTCFKALKMTINKIKEIGLKNSAAKCGSCKKKSQ